MFAPSGKTLLRRVAVWLGIGIAHVAMFLVVHPYLLGGDRFLGWDAVLESWGDLVYARKALAAGSVPLWNPHERGGYPFLADPQTGVLYPLNWIVYVAGSLFGDGHWLALLRPILHYAVAGMGMHALLGWLGFALPSRWVGSTAFVLAGRVAKSKDSAGLWSPVWLPWVMLAVYLCVRRPSLRSGMILAVVTSFAFYSGYPPNVFRIYVAAAVVGVVLLWEASKAAERARVHIGRVGAAVAAAAVVSLLLMLPAIFATVEVLPYTVRAGLRVEDVIDSAVRPYMWTELFYPRLTYFRSYGYPYTGMLPALLAVLALVKPTRVRITWLVVGAVFFLLGCGHRTPLLPFAVEWLPGFKLWRIPEQYLFVTDFAVVMLAAFGLEDVLGADDAAKRRLVRALYALTGIVVVGGLIAAWVHMSLPRTPESEAMAKDGVQWGTWTQIRIASVGVGLALASCGLIRAVLTGKRGWKIAAMCLGLPLMLGDMGHQLRRTYDISNRSPDTRRDALLANLDPSQGRRIADDSFFRWRVGARTGALDMFGRYSTMVGARHKKYVRKASTDDRLLGHAAVRWYAGRNARRLMERADGRVEPIAGGLYTIEAAPYAFWTSHMETFDTAKSALKSMGRVSPGTQAIFNREDVDAETLARFEALTRTDAPDGARAAVPAEVVRHDWNVIDLEIDAPASGIVVVAESWFPGWDVRVDGAKAEHVPVNFLFGAIPVEAGSHRIQMRYAPPRVLAGLAIWASTLLALIFGGLWTVVRSRRNSIASPTSA